MNLKNVLNFLGLWAYPFGLAVSGMVLYFIRTIQMQSFSVDEKTIKTILIGGLIAPFFVTILNTYDFFAKGRKDFTPSLTFKRDVTKISASKQQAMYKRIGSNDGLLSNRPEGLIFGVQDNKYVSLPVGKAGMRDGVSAVILGSPGSGKSVFLTNFLLNNFMQEKPTPIFCLDIKPELARKSVKLDENKNVKVVDFTDRSKAGWDVYFSISRDTKEDEKMRVFDGISRALIVSNNPKDKFFVNNARTILKFLLLYHFNKGLGFIDGITKVISEDVGEHIKQVLEDKECCTEGSLVYNGLKKYEGKAIKILAPCPYKKKVETEVTDAGGNIIIGSDGKPVTEEYDKVLMGFKIANVFDLSQTEGEPLPSLTNKLDGGVNGYADFMEALKHFSPVPIEFKAVEGSANGYYHLIDKNIVVDADMSQAMLCKTAIHEITHALLHDKDTGLEKDSHLDKRTKEVQAESVAYVVANYYSLDTAEYSFGYIAGWSSGRDTKELKASLDTIRQTAQAIINRIDQALDVLKQSRQLEAAVSVSMEIEASPKIDPAHIKGIKH